MNVTFILFSYNQQDYIEDAVRAVFEQDFYDYEIIITDDCSTDATWEIIRKVASSYSRKDKVVLNRNERNLGIISHIKKAISLASGDIIVVGAGDDVSESTRVSRLLEEYKDSEVKAVYSSVRLIDRNDVLAGHWNGPSDQKYRSLLQEAFSFSPQAIGASMSWRKELFNDFPKIADSVWAEDKVLSFRAKLLGTLRFVESPLVKYRRDTGVSSPQELKKLPAAEHVKRDFYVTKQKFLDAFSQKAFHASFVVLLGFICRLFKLGYQSIFLRLKLK